MPHPTSPSLWTSFRSRSLFVAVAASLLVSSPALSGAELPPEPPVAKPLNPNVAKPGGPAGAKPAAPPVNPAGANDAKEVKPPQTPPVKTDKPATAKPDAKTPTPPEPQRTTLDTKDGWKLQATYYGPMEGVRKGQEVVPIIALHGWGGQGGEYSFLAAGLQAYGHATLVVDLRGHGRSTTKRLGGGDTRTIKHDKLEPLEIQNMVNDLEAAKKFLVQKNNEGEVNIDMLCVIAADVSCIPALNWSVMDWSWPATTAGKQGQDVKALVLLSPVLTFKGQNATQALTTPVISRTLSIMLAVGEKDRKDLSEVMRTHLRLERARSPVSKEDKEGFLNDLWLVKADTNLQGTKLLDRQLKVNNFIAGFLDRRLVKLRDDYPWAERKSALSGG